MEEVDRKLFKKIIWGYTLFFGLFSGGVIGSYVFANSWFGRFGRVSVDWGIVMMFILHGYIDSKMMRKDSELREKELLEKEAKEDGKKNMDMDI